MRSARLALGKKLFVLGVEENACRLVGGRNLQHNNERLRCERLVERNERAVDSRVANVFCVRAEAALFNPSLDTLIRPDENI